MSATAIDPARAWTDHCLELLQSLGPCNARRMFGGWGIYHDGLFFALIVSERLYFKVDALTESLWREAGGEPFIYAARGRQVKVRYYTPPDEALESSTLMLPWARLGLEAALRARSAGTARTRLSAKPAAAPAPKRTTRRRAP